MLNVNIVARAELEKAGEVTTTAHMGITKFVFVLGDVEIVAGCDACFLD